MERRSKIRVLLISLLLFGLPGLAILMNVHFLVPWLVNGGLPLLHAWTIAVIGPTVLTGAGTVVYYVHTASPDWQGFKHRFRLHRPNWKQLLLVPFLAVVILLFNESFAWTIPILRDLAWIPEPPVTPEIFDDPYEAMKAEGSVTFMGIPLEGSAWWVAIYWVGLWMILGVLGEEIVWRGFLLPMQEEAFGRWAWLLNGLLWNIPFHLYTMTAVFADMPFFLLLPLAAQWLKNTWFAVLVHALLASLALLLILPGIVR